MSYYAKNIQIDANYEMYVQYIADLDMSAKEKYELLFIVSSILSHFVDHAFNVQTDQITLQSIGASGRASLGHVTTETHSETQTASAPRKGVGGESNPTGPSEP